MKRLQSMVRGTRGYWLCHGTPTKVVPGWCQGGARVVPVMKLWLFCILLDIVQLVMHAAKAGTVLGG